MVKASVRTLSDGEEGPRAVATATSSTKFEGIRPFLPFKAPKKKPSFLDVSSTLSISPSLNFSSYCGLEFGELFTGS